MYLKHGDNRLVDWIAWIAVDWLMWLLLFVRVWDPLVFISSGWRDVFNYPSAVELLRVQDNFSSIL